MGISLVEYRNRKRIARFREAMGRLDRVHSMKQAAYEAGFGSYAQFNRVHKQVGHVEPPRHDARGPASRAAQRPAPWPPR
jgi:methylphosphotriester-DNA--protein-cysteine methyltransferase